jgi:hypothetical protein
VQIYAEMIKQLSEELSTLRLKSYSDFMVQLFSGMQGQIRLATKAGCRLIAQQRLEDAKTVNVGEDRSSPRTHICSSRVFPRRFVSDRQLR